MVLSYDLAEKMIGWFAVMALCVVLGTIFLVRTMKARDSEVESTKYVFFAYTMFFYMFAVTRLLFYFSDLERQSLPPGVTDSTLYNQWVLLAYIASLVAMIFIVHMIEMYALARDRKILTLITMGVTALCVAFTVATLFTDVILNVARVAMYGAMGVLFLSVFYLFFQLARNSSGTLRKNAFLSIVGILILLVGILADSEFVTAWGFVPIWLPAIIAGVGLFIFALGQRKAT